MHVHVTYKTTQLGTYPVEVSKEDLPEVAFSIGDRYYSNGTKSVEQVVSIESGEHGFVALWTVDSRNHGITKWYASDVLNMIERGDWEREEFVYNTSIAEDVRTVNAY